MALTLSDDTNSQWFRNVFVAKQYFDDWLASIKQQDCSFSGTEKKNQITANTWRAFQLQEAVISLEAGQMSSYILAERFCQHQIENYFGR